MFLYNLYLFKNSKKDKVYKVIGLFFIGGNKVGISGSVYVGNKGTYIAVYGSFSDIYNISPSSEAKRIAHISYGFENFRHGIDVFQVNRDDVGAISNNVNFKRSISAYEIDDKLEILNKANINKKQGICYEIISDIKGTKIEKEILYFAQKDIKDFCKKEAINQETKKVYLDKIMPETKVKFVKPKFILQGGKQEFVSSCRLGANIDFSSGCVSSFIPVETEGAYKKGFMYGFIDFLSECSYCYSNYKHRSFLKNMLEIDKEKLKNELEGDCHLDKKNKLGKKIEVLRLGKRTEAGSKYTLDQLVTTLEVCLETGTKVVMPTKFLDFNYDVAELLKKTKSSLLYSIGWDKFERGACLNGCNNEFRLEQAVRYKKEKVNSIIYLLIDAANPPHDREKKILYFAEKNKLPVSLLPIRINSKSIALEITGISWLANRGQLMLPLNQREAIEGGYDLAKNKDLTVRRINKEWEKLIENNNGNIRMCHHNEDKTWCSACFLEGNKGVIKENNNHSLRNAKKVLI